MTTELPDVDREAALAMWREYAAAAQLEHREEPVIECFGDSPQLADELLDAVRYGDKRATSSVVNEYAYWDEKLPEAGKYWVICDGAGQPQLIVRIDSVELSSFYEVDAEFAAAEGEGDRSLEHWRTEHAKFWTRTHQAMGVEWTPEMTQKPGHEIVKERFSIVWPPANAD